jgi:hypothetical protein
MVVHTFNPNIQEAEAGGFLSLRPAWSTKWVPGQPGLYRETLSKKKKKKKKEKGLYRHLWKCPEHWDSCHRNLVIRFASLGGGLPWAGIGCLIGGGCSETTRCCLECIGFLTRVAPSVCQGPENIICSCVSPCGSWIAYSTASRFFLYRLKYERDNISLQRVSEGGAVCSWTRRNFCMCHFCLTWQWIGKNP